MNARGIEATLVYENHYNETIVVLSFPSGHKTEVAFPNRERALRYLARQGHAPDRVPTVATCEM